MGGTLPSPTIFLKTALSKLMTPSLKNEAPHLKNNPLLKNEAPFQKMIPRKNPKNWKLISTYVSIINQHWKKMAEIP